MRLSFTFLQLSTKQQPQAIRELAHLPDRAQSKRQAPSQKQKICMRTLTGYYLQYTSHDSRWEMDARLSVPCALSSGASPSASKHPADSSLLLLRMSPL